MASISAKDVAELRRRTGAGMMDCKKALAESGGDFDKATEWLRAHGAARAEKRAERTAKQGLIEAYVHHSGKLGVLLELSCETDFVARTDDFKQLARDVAMHIAASAPLAVTAEELPAEVVERERRIYTEQVAQEGKPEAIRAKIVEGKLKKFYGEAVLLEQPYVKDDTRTVGDIVKELSGKTGEKVAVRRFVRFQLGEDV
ncbi:MAG TPA: translation elongation factor Ts [Gemmatimonadales bacterium]|nr:translation elongation factor Ts [Gemmatimonadales bacterium]